MTGAGICKKCARACHEQIILDVINVLSIEEQLDLATVTVPADT
jgi:hypothetical protein